MTKNFETDEENLKLASPCVTFCMKLEELFAVDPDITVDYSDDGSEFKLFVDGAVKADALTKLLPEVKNFGNLQTKITVIPANDGVESIESLIRAAFNGNRSVASIETYEDFTGTKETFVIFDKEVVQVKNDNIASPYGLTSTLNEDTARELFEDCGCAGIFFSTSNSVYRCRTANGTYVYRSYKEGCKGEF